MHIVHHVREIFVRVVLHNRRYEETVRPVCGCRELGGVSRQIALIGRAGHVTVYRYRHMRELRACPYKCLQSPIRRVHKLVFKIILGRIIPSLPIRALAALSPSYDTRPWKQKKRHDARDVTCGNRIHTSGLRPYQPPNISGPHPPRSVLHRDRPR